MFRVIIYGFALVSIAVAFSCKNQENEDVDWFTIYKMPILGNDTSIPGVSNGTGFYYMDVRNKKFVASAATLQSREQSVAFTLQQMYDALDNADVFHVLYNDEFPETTVSNTTTTTPLPVVSDASITYGHTKGVVFFNNESGVWLIHSVPKFPPLDKYEYPTNGMDYGQTFLCLTLKYDQLAQIGTQLYYNHPHIYSSALPTQMAAENPDLASVIGKKHKTGFPTSSIFTLTSAEGYKFLSFAKTGEFGDDLYAGLVAPTLQVGLNVETWRRGYAVDLVCNSSFTVLDALSIKVGISLEFIYTKDHSKYAVSTDSLACYVCIGDINRMTSQFTRGGGTACFSDMFVWKAFKEVIASTNHC